VSAEAWAAVVMSVLTSLGAAGTFVWAGGRLSQRTETLAAWLRDLAEGKGAACAQHRTQLSEHDRRLERIETKVFDGEN